MQIQNPQNRLQSLWGKIDRQHCERIAQLIGQKEDKSRVRVLDIGSGYGSLVAYLQDQGFDAVGLEPDAEVFRTSQKIFPGRTIFEKGIEDLPDGIGPFDAIVMKDSLHHVANEADLGKSMECIRKVLAPEGRLIVWEPNPMFLLKMARLIIRHQDFELPIDKAEVLLREQGFEIVEKGFYEICGLVLSGGYVGPRLVPDNEPCFSLCAGLNRSLSSLFNRLNLGSHFCWRYYLSARKI